MLFLLPWRAVCYSIYSSILRNSLYNRLYHIQVSSSKDANPIHFKETHYPQRLVNGNVTNQTLGPNNQSES